MISKITLGELEKYLRLGGVLIDVRDTSEYQSGHLLEAHSIPLSSLLEKTRNFPKDQILIVYCSTGSRSRLAAHLLASMGHTKIYDLGAVRVNES